MENPTLRIRTLKRKSDNIDYRYIPVNKVDFNEINSYIKIYRSKVIKNTIGKINDEGYLLINENTGKEILPITISNEINKIRKAAGIEENVCAHMFRHRFESIEKEKQRLLSLLKNKEITNKEYINRIENL